jgi:phospholipid/cholesterol/gamma-HCH transport system ATP-binding protein
MAAAEREVKIRLAGVHKSFGAKVVLDGVDLEVEAGSSTVVIGGSGTGKSVLLKHIVGLLRPDSGVVEVDGVEIGRLTGREVPQFRRRIGMAFQEGALFDSMTVAENVAFPLTRLDRRPRAGIRDRVAECLALVRLDDTGAKMPSELSGGMRRRVGIARAIVHQPDILLLDEPTTGLDPVTKATIDELIIELKVRLGSTLLTISHDMGSVFRIADRIAMLYDGKIIATLSPEAMRRSTDPRVAEFLRRDLEMWSAGRDR